MKTLNSYVAQMSDLYSAAPKAVLGAVAFSFAARLVEGEGLLTDSPEGWARVRRQVYLEWRALYQAGIVPQSPPGGKGAPAADLLDELGG